MNDLPLRCRVNLHRWVDADKYGWLRYCARCEKFVEDIEAAILVHIEGMVGRNKGTAYIDRIAPEHARAVHRYLDGGTLWQRATGKQVPDSHAL